MKYTVSKLTGAVSVMFCPRQGRFLPMEEHMDCDYAVAPVWDENGDPVSFICMFREERREFRRRDEVPEEELGISG
jgi:hypothetical protein